MRRNYLRSLCDHLDVRVRDVDRARRFYDPFCEALGLGVIDVGAEWVSYTTGDPTDAFVAITAEPHMVPSPTRIAFRADSNDDVDRIAAAAKAGGATEFEPPRACPEYSQGYYASFFADLDGNRYEICHRPLSPTIARVWRSRVRPHMLHEYRDYVAATGLADYVRTPGNRGAVILTRFADDRAEILTVSLWNSRESIERFAGKPIDRARYYPEDHRFLLEPPTEVEHFEATF